MTGPGLRLAMVMVLSVAVPARADNAPDLGQVAGEPAWLALGHYRAHADGWKSDADRPDFFLSPQGQISPTHELVANLAAMQADSNFACRFPARYEWLRDRLRLALPKNATAQCPTLEAWYRQFPGQRVSISFAASYMENPSSMFGHTFLKVYQHSNRELLSPTINYAARTDAREGDLSFMRKGLLGGFPGVADELPFYRRLRTYTENEGRDIWEYELALAPAELRTLLLHLWEVRDGVFNYYFLDENCAYRTLALLDVARPGLGLLDGHRKLTVPVDTIRTLQAAGLAGERTLWPAFPKQVRHHEQQLDRNAVNLAGQLAAGALAPSSLSAEPAERRSAILELAYDYLSVQISRDQAERETRKLTMNSILRARMEDVSAPATATAPAAPVAPELGHAGGALAAGAFDNRHARGASLTWSGFRHTLTDRLAGYEPHAAITVLQPEVRFSAGNARVHRVDWLDVESTLPNSALFSRPAWRLALATQRKQFHDRERGVTSLGFSSGRAWYAGGAVLAVMPGVGLDAGSAGGAAATMASQLTRQGSDWSAQLGWRAEKSLLGSEAWRTSVRLNTAFFLSRNVSLDLHARREFHPQPRREAGMALRFHLRPLSLTQ